MEEVSVKVRETYATDAHLGSQGQGQLHIPHLLAVMQFMMLIEVGQGYHWSEAIYDFFLKALYTLKHHFLKKTKGENWDFHIA